ILMFFLLNSYIKYVPKFILFISNYSFSIYLLHLVFLNKMTMLSNNVWEDILFKFIITITLSICVGYLVNITKYGKYLVGNIVNTKHESIRSEEHTSELQSRFDLVCRLLLEKKKMGLHMRPPENEMHSIDSSE